MRLTRRNSGLSLSFFIAQDGVTLTSVAVLCSSFHSTPASMISTRGTVRCWKTVLARPTRMIASKPTMVNANTPVARKMAQAMPPGWYPR